MRKHITGVAMLAALLFAANGMQAQTLKDLKNKAQETVSGGGASSQIRRCRTPDPTRTLGTY